MAVVNHSEFLVNLGNFALVSSRERAWDGLLVEQHCQPPGEIMGPPLSQHLVTLMLGCPSHLMQKRDGRVYAGTVHRGDVLVTAAAQDNYWQWNTQLTTLHLLFEPSFVLGVAESIGMSTQRAEIVNNFGTPDPHIERFGQVLIAELQSEGLGGRLYGDSLVNILTVHLLRHYSASGQTPSSPRSGLSKVTLHKVIEFIHDNLGGDVSLSEIADVAGLSPNYFVVMFKQSTGLAPHQYVIKSRVEQAECLLVSGKLSVGEVAAQVGFCDQSHLTRHFKNLRGVTPKRLLLERGKS